MRLNEQTAASLKFTILPTCKHFDPSYRMNLPECRSTPPNFVGMLLIEQQPTADTHASVLRRQPLKCR
jgi:hypothetical protein